MWPSAHTERSGGTKWGWGRRLANRGLAALAVIAVGNMAFAPAASGADLAGVPYQPFALHPGPYCGFGDGKWSVFGGPQSPNFLYDSLTASKKGSPNCPNPSPAATGTFAAQAVLYRYFIGEYRVCEFVHNSNESGESIEVATDISDGGCSLGCYSNTSRFLRAEWRITYAGQNQYGSGNSPSHTTDDC